MVGASFSSRCRTASAVHFEASAIRRSAWSARGLAIKFVDQLQLSDEFVGEFSVAVANQSDVVEGDEGLVLQGSPATERIRSAIIASAAARAIAQPPRRNGVESS